MALINITPVMTSNTAPSPYVISGSEVVSTSYDWYKAFTNTNIDNHDSCIFKDLTGWIKIDFGSNIKIDAISMQSFNYSVQTNMFKDAILYGSNDDSMYYEIINISNQILWGLLESRLFKFGNSVNFRYYKLMLLSCNGAASSGLSEIKFWQDDSIEYITNKKASGNYTLPHNSTLAMKQRQNDNRPYLLGCADDDINFGTLWIIDKTGHAQLAKSSLASFDILFDGAANIVGDYQLNGDISKYKLIIAASCLYTSNIRAQIDLQPIIPKDIILNIDQFLYNTSTASTSRRMFYKFTDNFTLNIISNEDALMRVFKIYGIK
jgi:hypothetical protein